MEKKKMEIDSDTYYIMAKNMFEPFKPAFIEMAKDVINEVATKEVHTKEYLNCKMACEYIGVSHVFLQKLERLGLKAIHIDGKKLFKKSTIDEFLTNQQI